jgi:hypothetical protein
MDPVKPSSVGANAVMIPPSVTQPNSLASIEASNAHDNAEALKSWANGMDDWKTNAEIDHNLGKDVQPRPQKPDIYRTKVTYADIYGVIHPEPRADNGDYYAWIETVVS